MHSFMPMPDCQGVTVIAIRGDHMVVIAEQGDRPDGNGFLADVKVKKSAHFALAVKLERRLLEAANTNHLVEERDLFFRAKSRIYRSFCVVGGSGYGCGVCHFLQ